MCMMHGINIPRRRFEILPFFSRIPPNNYLGQVWVRGRFSDPSVYDGEINPSKDELDGGRFWTLEEIRAAIGQQTLTPNFESEFQRFFL